ncbi:riboflavin synthase [Paenibacillus sp. LMG 31456]|uniref:Riboflavin synthase n=1 Tax=Paenibacillus foliorum TaxID=2654974 RepID=A0A972GWV9_9BACL|nr:riboflavin synthase [Paenibacillus foliorum]NOU97610.1 riboflavin synthase [Paenibacillus foliorum]
MFTGIIEEIGTMRRITKQGQAMVLTVGAKRILEDVHLGDSISVNGVCLTVIQFDETSITVDVMPETFRRTSLQKLHIGDRVNLERAMASGGRFGGHIVQGHVDSTGIITGRTPEENAVVFQIEPEDTAILKYMIPHGSITIDGISLTLVHVSEQRFTVSIIPHTLAQTVLQTKQPGDQVNLEADVLGKYVEKLLNFRSGGETVKRQSTLTEAFLADNGFI